MSRARDLADGTFDTLKVFDSALTDSLTLSVDTASSYAVTGTVDDVGLSFDNNTSIRGYRFSTNGSEKVRIDSNGLKFNGDTAAANALDDYEFGSWSPYWSDASGNAIFNANPSVNMARYEKIGNMVTCWTYFNMGSGFGTTGSYSASGTLYVSGLPFTADGDGSGGTANYYAGSVSWYNSWNNYDGSSVGFGPMCYTVTGTTRLILEYPGNNRTFAIIQSNVNSNNSAIILNIVYQTSA